MCLSNILFIKDDFFVKHSVSSYSFVGACDALISDYSSIYFDFTLCDKPVGVIWEDIEEYKRSPGLVDNYEHYLRGAEKIYTFDDLKDFVIRVSCGEDVLRQERREVMNEVNISTDGKNSARVVDFILEKISEIKRKDVYLRFHRVELGFGRSDSKQKNFFIVLSGSFKTTTTKKKTGTVYLISGTLIDVKCLN